MIQVAVILFVLWALFCTKLGETLFTWSIALALGACLIAVYVGPFALLAFLALR